MSDIRKKKSFKEKSKKTKPGKHETLLERPDQPLRLNRYIAQAGVCSRRKADTLIQDQLVKVNGEVVTDFSYQVQSGDSVEVNGKVISPRAFAYYLVNKPEDTITTTSDEKGRRTVLDLLDLTKEEKKGLYPVGRLDRNTVGTLLITNDGELANRLMHPRYQIEKNYLVRTKESVKPHDLEQLKAGVMLEDGLAKADLITYVNPPNYHEVGIQIHEGRNRQIRRMFETLGYEVDALERLHYAGLTTSGLRRGKWRKLQPHEIDRLRHLVHLK